jgi:D-glycero-alpha-D-manno-heptose-7-phosphate kinase
MTPSLSWQEAPASLKFPAFLVVSFLSKLNALPEGNMEIRLSADFPLRSGLGGSSCVAVGIVRGLSRLFGGYVEQGWQWDLMHWVRDVEAAFLRVPTGTQDYLAALFGGLNTFVSGFGGMERQPFPADVATALGEHLLVMFSGEMHHSGMSNWELFKRAYDGESTMWEGLHSISQIATQLDAELRGHVNWKYVGKCMTEEWQVRSKTFKVNTPRLTEILQFLDEQKVWGAKVCGAAQGGSLIAIVDPDRREKVASHLTKAGVQVLQASPEMSGVHLKNNI